MKPRPDAPKPPTVALALMVLVLMSAGLIGIVAVIIPGVLLMVIAGFGLVLTFTAQYFLWARWLYPIVVRMERERTETDGDNSGRSSW